MGFGNGEQELHRLVEKIKKNKDALHRILRTDILVIDEISMLSSELFEKINIILKHFRQSHSLFGGIQVVLSGDFLQLEPVFNDNNENKRLLYENKEFKKQFNKSNTIILKHNYRQNLDNKYADILNRIRLNNHSKEDVSFIDNLSSNTSLNNPVELVSSNRIANEINKRKLNEINSKEYIFKKNILKNDCKILAESLIKQFDKFDLHEIKLKKKKHLKE
jgi:ATP-dependent DNA helicase PIF1